MKKLVHLSILLIIGLLANGQINIEDLSSKRVESDGTVVWQQVSCGNGGMSNTIRYHPTIPGHVTMLGDMWCSYQSINNGKRWYNINDYNSDGSFQRQRDLIYSLDNPEFGLSLCSSELYQTLDTGKTWQPVPNCPWYEAGDPEGMDRSSWKSKVAGLGIDPNNKDIWFVGGGKLVRGDQSFSCYIDITQVEPHGHAAANQGKMWIATLGTGFYKGEINEGDNLQVIKMTPGYFNCENGAKTQLSASIVNSNYEGNTISWKTENPAIATVDQNGLVTPVGRGKTKIWASTEDSRFSNYCLFVAHKSHTSNKNLDEGNLRIIPIPVENNFSIEGVEDPCSVEVCDLKGKSLIRTNSKKNIMVSELNNGVYIVKIKYGSKTRIRKFLKV